MTDLKKNYILEALGEVEDSYIEEAVAYKRVRRGWHYGRELSSLAACLVVLAVAGFVYKYMPIGNTTDNAAQKDCIQENADQSGSIVCTDQSGDVTYKMVFTEKASELENKENLVEMEGQKEETDRLWESVGNLSDSEGTAGIQQNTEQEASCMKWMSAEQILSQDLDVFLGTVTERTVYQMTAGEKFNFTVLTVQVEDSIKGTAQVSQSYTIYLPVGVSQDLVTESGISGDLLKLEAGSRAVFMPYQCSPESGQWIDGRWHGYDELAQYYMSEGIRYLILETEEGLSFAKDVYQVEGGSQASLDQAAEYLRKLVGDIEN